jgi:hypothetical protein
MYKPFFKEDETYNLQGIDVTSQIQEALRPIVEAQASMNFSMRDLAAIAIDTVQLLCHSEIIKRIHTNTPKDV